MGRNAVTVQSKEPFKSRSLIRVRHAETDAMRVAYHGSYLPWFEVGRTDLIRELGYPYKQLEAEGVFMPVIELSCRYVKPVHYDDDLELFSWIDELQGVRIKMMYELFRAKVLVAKGFTIHAFTDGASRPLRPPGSFIQRVTAPHG